MKNYICNAQILAMPKTIAHFGDVIELDENEAYTKTLVSKNLIYPEKVKQPKNKVETN